MYNKLHTKFAQLLFNETNYTGLILHAISRESDVEGLRCWSGFSPSFHPDGHVIKLTSSNVYSPLLWNLGELVTIHN